MDHRLKGTSVRLDDLALPKLGAKIGVGEDEIHAFLDVETPGHGFDASGRPCFYRNLAGAARAQAQGVSKGWLSKVRRAAPSQGQLPAPEVGMRDHPARERTMKRYHPPDELVVARILAIPWHG